MLNQPRYQGASVLLARKNFGCGSSREHAPWALQQFGFRALIAPSYADIFFNNCFKNGLLPIVLPEHQVAALFDEADGLRRLPADDRPRAPGRDQARRQRARLRGRAVPQVLPARRLDDIALTLRHADKIRAFEAERLLKQPWLATTIR